MAEATITITGSGKVFPIFVNTGWKGTQLKLKADTGGPYVLAIEMPKNAPESFGLEGWESESHAQWSSTDHVGSLQWVQGQIVSNGQAKVRLPDKPGYGFVGGTASQFKFKINVDTDHVIFHNEKYGYEVRPNQTLTFKTYVADLSEPAASWRAGPPLTLVLVIQRAPPSRAFAIDVGTSNTCAAYMAGDPPEPKLFEFQDLPSVPTLVAYDEVAPHGARKFKVGAVAARQAANGDLRRFVRGMKRYMGLEGRARQFQIFAGGVIQNLLAEDVYRDFLYTYLRDYQTRLNVSLKQVKATYPPDYRPQAKGAVKSIYEKFGIEQEKLDKLFGVDEASAAAVYYVWHRLETAEFDMELYRSRYGDEHNLLVFDVGGGTTDISMVKVTVEDKLEKNKTVHQVHMTVLGATSLLNVGGDNFTLAVLKALKARIAVRAAAHYQQNNSLLSQIKSEATRAALQELAADRPLFDQALSPPPAGSAPESEEQLRKSLARLDRLADRVIPTAWVRFETGPEEDVDLKEDAINDFYTLWLHAEYYKIQLCATESIKLDAGRFKVTSGMYGKAFEQLKLPPEVWDSITLEREADLYRRIRPRIAQAVRACKYVTLSPEGHPRHVDTIQLVGNSSRIPLVQDLVARAFADQIVGDDHIKFESVHAKSAVALGACLAAHLNDFGLTTRVRMAFDPLEEQLGWEVGEWMPPATPFETFFEATAKPSTRPHVDLDDTGRQDLTLYRRRHGQTEAPEKVGVFRLTDRPLPAGDLAAPPPGKLRLRLSPPDTLTLQRGRMQWPMIKPDRPLSIHDDPFCGEH